MVINYPVINVIKIFYCILPQFRAKLIDFILFGNRDNCGYKLYDFETNEKDIEKAIYTALLSYFKLVTVVWSQSVTLCSM